MWLLISLSLIEIIFIYVFASISLILSKKDKRSPSLFVKAVIIVETCRAYLMCPISIPPVVDKVVLVKQKAKPFLTNRISALLLKPAVGSHLWYQIQDMNYQFDDNCYSLREWIQYSDLDHLICAPCWW